MNNSITVMKNRIGVYDLYLFGTACYNSLSYCETIEYVKRYLDIIENDTTKLKAPREVKVYFENEGYEEAI